MTETRSKLQLFECYNCGEDFEEEIILNVNSLNVEKIKSICKKCIGPVLGRNKLK